MWSCDWICPRLSGLGGAVRRVYDHAGMGQNFISCDRGQVMLLPPSLTDWLPEDHLVWTMLAEQMDLDGFYGVYRANGQGRAAYDPARGSRHFFGQAFTSSSSPTPCG